MKGKRVVWPERGKVVLEDFDLADAPGEGQILTGAKYTMISPGTERAFLLGLPNTSQNYPQRAGYNYVGEIIKVGKGVNELKEGDIVVASSNHASHAILSAASVLKVPKVGAQHAVPLEHAAFFNLGSIALQGVRKAKIELGESVLIMGQGLIGQLALQLSKLDGGLPVIASDMFANRLKVSVECGADVALKADEPTFVSQLMEATKDGAAVVIEATGHPEPVNQAFKLARNGGRVVLLASSRGETQAVNFYRDVHKKGLIVLGAHASVRPSHDSYPGYWSWRNDCQTILRLMAHKRLMLDPLITHRFSYTQVVSAYELLMAWDAGLMGVIFDWS